MCMLVFFFNDTATTEIYTLSLHDALPILQEVGDVSQALALARQVGDLPGAVAGRLELRDLVAQVIHLPQARLRGRSEEHTSELQSRQYLVCRLLLEKKKTTRNSQVNRMNP